MRLATNMTFQSAKAVIFPRGIRLSLTVGVYYADMHPPPPMLQDDHVKVCSAPNGSHKTCRNSQAVVLPTQH